MRTREIETFEDDGFTAALARGLAQRAMADVDGAAPTLSVRAAVRRDHRRRLVAGAVAGALAVTGLAVTTLDPAGSKRLVVQTAARFGLALDDALDTRPAGGLGDDDAWIRAVESVVDRRLAEETGDDAGAEEAPDSRVLWADDLAGARRAVVSGKTPGGQTQMMVLIGPRGAAAAAMELEIRGPVTTGDWAVWRSYSGDPVAFVYAPSADSGSWSPLMLDAAGRVGADWRELRPLGNGVWLARDVPSRVLRFRITQDGRESERASDEGVAYRDPADVLGRKPRAVAEAAAVVQRDVLSSSLGWPTTDDALSLSRPDKGRSLVVEAVHGPDEGAWAVSAWFWSTSAVSSIGASWGPVTIGEVDWYPNGRSASVAAPAKDADDLMVVLPVADTEGGSGVKKVVVLTPREAAQVRVGARTYPVEGRIAVLEDSRLGTSDQAVAVDGTGRTLGTARLPVASPIDGLFVPR